MKTNDKSKPPRKNKISRQTGTGKGNLTEKNPLAGQKERTPQTNNLGKFGEGQGQQGIMGESDKDDTESEQEEKDTLVKQQKKKPDAEEMNESDEELFDDEEPIK
jgi:hypothetical protein